MALQEAQGSQYLLETLLRAPTAELQIEMALSVVAIEGDGHIFNIVALPRQAAAFYLPRNLRRVIMNAHGLSVGSFHLRNKLVFG